LVGSSSATAGGCVLGTYTAYYKTSLSPSHCYAVSQTAGTALENLLDGAAAHNITVHVTPAMPHRPFAWPPSSATQPNKTAATYFTQLADLQVSAFADIWAAFPQHHKTIGGVYTALEQWNGPGWMGATVADALAREYLGPLSVRVKTIGASRRGASRPDAATSLQVWGSPYYVGNKTLHPTASSPEDYASFWQSTWRLAKGFDWIGLQDARGWQGNSDAEVAQALASLAHVAKAEDRQLWSNVELFEGWPLPCEYPKPCGRHPAPIERIVAQLASESPHVGGRHIAWEWSSCLSPYTNENTSALYAQYAEYVRTGSPVLSATSVRDVL
jgi:hypothetical protein